MHFDVHQLDQFLLVGSAVVLLAILGVRISFESAFPTLLLFLGLGALLGEEGIGIQFENAELAHALGFAALAVILAEGGLTTTWRDVRPTFKLGLVLATLGVVVSALVVATGTHYLLGLSWNIALLLGAVTAATDAAAVFSVLRTVPMPRRISGTLENESGLNDAPTVTVVTLISIGAFDEQAWWLTLGIVIYEVFFGAMIGLGVGWLGARLLRRMALPSSGLYPLTIMALCFLAYGAAAGVHASGFAAIYVAGLVLGNSELPHRMATRSFAEGLAWICQIGLFVMLGLLLSPGRITWSTVVLAVLAGLILTFVARPLSVLASSWAAPMGWRDYTFISWAGLRGAVPVVLMTIPLAKGVPGAHQLFDLVFVLVVIYTLITAPTLPWLAKFLRLSKPSDPRDLELEAAPLEKIAADMLMVSITPESKMHGVAVHELRLPVGASVSLIVREGRMIVPEDRTTLRHGDDLLVVAPRKVLQQTESRLRRVSAHGRLAGWVAPPRGQA